MRVLNKGEIQVLCKRCNALLAVTAEDIHYNNVWNNAPPFMMTCGACHKQAFLNNEEVPTWMQTQIHEGG